MSLRSTPRQLDRNNNENGSSEPVAPRLRSVGSGPLSIKLPDDSAKTVRELAEDKGITATEVLKRGIALERFITDQLDAGNVFLVQRPGGQLERVHFVFA